MNRSDSDFPAVLRAARSGDARAKAQLISLLYTELRRLARARMAHLPPGQTLQPTALVHEVYLRLLAKRDFHPEGQKQFFFAAARAMRDILVEQARRKAGPKRGGGRKRVGLAENVAIIEPPSDNVLALHEALAELETRDQLKAQIVELRYFGGLTVAETAAMLGLAERTVHRHWRFAKAWLAKRLQDAE